MKAAALPRFPRLYSLLFCLALSTLLSPARADEDPPARAGRVAEISGEAWLFDAEDKEWVQLERNQTIGPGDRLRTDGGGRLSLRVGSTSLWLDEDSDLEFSRLDDGRVELRLDKGSLALRLRNREEVNDYLLLTREGRFSAEREGLYRIDQLERGSRALNWEGSLRFDSRAREAAPVWLQADEQAEFWWADGPRTERQRLQRDEFADWLLAQREAEGRHLANSYVSPEMTGADELDRHGRWEQSSEYGPLWTPSVVAVDWAPYRYGRWGWTRAWGWSWIDAAPWGFAPFHYGRWVHHGGRWCWAPGAYVARPVYAPALVAWVGGPAVSVGIHIGGGRPPPPRYGWYPLAPREAYLPGYRHSPGYWQRVNREHGHGWQGRPEHRRHRNIDVPGAVSLLPEQGRGRPSPFNPGQMGPLRPVTQVPGRGELPQWQVPRVRPPQAIIEPRPPRERPDRPERIDRVDRIDRNERFERVERPDRGDRAERGERFERPGWTSRPGRPADGVGPPRPTPNPNAGRSDEPLPSREFHGRPPGFEPRVPGRFQERGAEPRPQPQIGIPAPPRGIERPQREAEPARPPQVQQPQVQQPKDRGPQRERGEWNGGGPGRRGEQAR